MKFADKVKRLDKVLVVTGGLLIAGLLCLFVYYAFLRAPTVVGVISHGDERVNLPADGSTALEGVVTYPVESLPDGVIMTIQLRDLANQDSSSNLIAEQIIVNPAPSGVSFRLDYEADAVDSDSLYVIQADISLNGQVLFSSGVRPGATPAQLVDVEINLEPLRATIPTQTPEPPAPPAPEEPTDENTTAPSQATYDDQLELPDGSRLVVRVEALNQEPFAGNTLVAERTFSDPGQSPLSFSLYPDERLDDSSRYFVLVRVYGPEGQTILTNNFPDKVYRPEELPGLSVNLELINPPADSPLASKLTGNVTGQVTYGNARLPTGAKFIAQIRDTSLADAPSDLIAEQVITNPDQSPVEFEIKYDESKIQTRQTYSLFLRIVSPDDKLLFVNDTVYEVITRGHPKSGLSVPLKKIR